MSASPTSTAPGDSPQPAPSKDLSQLRHILRFVLPYRWQMFGALVALTVAAGTVLPEVGDLIVSRAEDSAGSTRTTTGTAVAFPFGENAPTAVST